MLILYYQQFSRWRKWLRYYLQVATQFIVWQEIYKTVWCDGNLSRSDEIREERGEVEPKSKQDSFSTGAKKKGKKNRLRERKKREYV